VASSCYVGLEATTEVQWSPGCRAKKCFWCFLVYVVTSNTIDGGWRDVRARRMCRSVFSALADSKAFGAVSEVCAMVTPGRLTKEG
jgi:hypothetical protein